MSVIRRTLFGFVLLAAILLPPVTTRGQDVDTAIKQLDHLLAGKQVDSFYRIKTFWELAKDGVLGDLDTSLRLAREFADYGLSPEPMRYQKIPEECADNALECINAAEKKLLKTDLKGQFELGRDMARTADLYLARGQGDKADDLNTRARAHLEAAAAQKKPPAACLVELGTLYAELAQRQPNKFKEWTSKAVDMFDRARKIAGDSIDLALRVGKLKVMLAETKEAESARKPRDRELKRAAKKLWKKALESLGKAVKIGSQNEKVTTAYDECLWNVFRVTGGRVREKPLMKKYHSDDMRITLELPMSSWWHVFPPNKRNMKDVLFEAVKYDPKANQALVIAIYPWLWDTEYTITDTGQKVGGDNIGGIARISEQGDRAYFKSVKKFVPLHRMALNRHIWKVEGYEIRGMTKHGDLFEFRQWFFKDPKAHKTYQIMVGADLGVLQKNPYELQTILETFDTPRH